MNTIENNIISVEVAYSTPTKQIIIPLNIPEHTNVIEVIKLSQIDKEFNELNLKEPETLQVGIFGKKIDVNTYQLRNMDRIEIYRPLNKTPNQKRLERAKSHG